MKYKYKTNYNKLANGGPTESLFDSLKSTLNPFNWGVNDYTESGNFDSAYSSAKKHYQITITKI